MADQIVFPSRDEEPNQEKLAVVLGRSFAFWEHITDYVRTSYPAAMEEWKFPGAKYGWSYRLKDKKRVIIYLIPQPNFFRVAFVFGAAATAQILTSDVADEIKKELKNARVYAEGRGIRIDVKRKASLSDILKLIDIKLTRSPEKK